MDEPRPRRRRNPELSRAAILEAARAVFAERGYAGATIREIAARAGVTHGLVMRHFGSKERLLMAALPGPRNVAASLPGDPEGLPDRIAAGFIGELESGGEDHALIALLRSAAAGEEAVMPMYRALEHGAAEAYRQVLVGPDLDLYVESLASLLLGVTFSRYIARTGRLAEMSADELIRHLAGLIRAVLAPVLPQR